MEVFLSRLVCSGNKVWFLFVQSNEDVLVEEMCECFVDRKVIQVCIMVRYFLGGSIIKRESICLLQMDRGIWENNFFNDLAGFKFWIFFLKCDLLVEGFFLIFNGIVYQWGFFIVVNSKFNLISLNKKEDFIGLCNQIVGQQEQGLGGCWFQVYLMQGIRIWFYFLFYFSKLIFFCGECQFFLNIILSFVEERVFGLMFFIKVLRIIQNGCSQVMRFFLIR